MRFLLRLPSSDHWVVPCLWALVALLLAGLAGCREKSAASADGRASAIDTPTLERDYFAVAIDFLKQRDEHNADLSAGQTNYYLNRWIRDQAADSRWSMDPLLNTLPDAIKRAPATKEMCSERCWPGWSSIRVTCCFSRRTVGYTQLPNGRASNYLRPH